MLRSIPGTLLILLTVLVIAASFAGVGLLVRRAFGLRDLDLDDLLSAFWTGFGAVIFLLLVWNFVLPIGGVALSTVMLVGAAGWYLWRDGLAAVGAETRTLPAWLVLGIVAAGLWVANHALDGPRNWDTALYHMQGVAWARHYRVPPGLANLFGPLGFNNSSLLYDALLDVGPWAGRSWHVANAVPVTVLAVQSLLGAARVLANRAMRAADLFAFLLFAAVLSLANGDLASSFVTDVPQTAVRLALIMLWYRMLIVPPRRPLAEAYDLVSLVLLAATAVSIKMNAAVFSAAVVAAAATAFLQRGQGAGVRRRTVAWCVTIALVFGLAWSARGVVLSGYPLFPSRVAAAPVAWRVPAVHAQAEFDYVVHSGRATAGNLRYVSGEARGLRVWFPRWIARVREDLYPLLVPLLITLASLPFLLSARRRATAAERAAVRFGWWIVPPTVIAFVAWFAVAPEPRYAAPITWGLAALVGAQAFALGAGRLSARQIRWLVGAIAVVGVSPLLLGPVTRWRPRVDGSLVRFVARSNIRVPPPGSWFGSRVGRPIHRPYTTRSGLVLQVPDRLCWDGPLPCTPNPAPNLRLRVPGRLDGGFVVDGPWAMEHWPQAWRSDYWEAWRASQRSAMPRGE